MSNIDDFFKKHLRDVGQGSNGWGRPPENMWDTLNPYFPKAKKKRRIIPLYWFGGLVLILTCFGYFGINYVKSSEDVNETKNQDIPQVELNKNTIVTEGSNESNENHIDEIYIQSAEVEKSLTSHQIQHNSDKVEKTSDNAVLKLDIIELTRSQSTQGVVINSDADHTFPDSEVIYKTESVGLALVDKMEKSMENGQATMSDKRLLASNIPLDNTIGLEMFPAILNLNIPIPLSVKPSIPSRGTGEIGISHALSVFSFKSEQKTIEPDMDEITLRPDYFNINLHYNKWLSNRLSISTGLYYNDINAQMDFIGFFVYDTGSPINTINEEFRTAILNGSLSDANVVSAEFIPGLNPTNGESLNIKGNAIIGLTGLQVPLIINYHNVRTKMEYNLGFGGIVNMIRETHRDVGLDIFNESTKISENVSVLDYERKYVDVSLIVQSGIKYNLSNHIKLGLSLRVYPEFVEFSGLEIGAYYRWYR